MEAVADPFTPALTPPRSSGILTTPHYERHGDEHTLRWTEPPVTMTVSRVHDATRGLHAEMIVTHGPARLHWAEFNLASASARETLVKKLSAELAGVPWRMMLEAACWTFAQAVRQGTPLVALTGKATSPTRELVPRLLYEGEPTLLYADGDTGKSLVGITLAVAVQSGAALPCGLKPARAVKAAILDWETGQTTADGLVGLVAAGLGIVPPGVLYKRMTRPLVAEAASLAAEFSRHRVGFVVIDSMMFAVAGGDGAAYHEPITGFYNVLRLLAPAAALVLSHVTGADARTNGPARPFGGAFAFNGPRLIWEAKRDREITDATAIAFTCTKANNLPRRPDPFGLRFQPGPGTITVAPFDLKDATPTVVAGANLAYRIRLALATSDLTVADLAKHLAKTEDTIRVTLKRMKDVVPVPDTRPAQWALASTRTGGGE